MCVLVIDEWDITCTVEWNLIYMSEGPSLPDPSPLVSFTHLIGWGTECHSSTPWKFCYSVTADIDHQRILTTSVILTTLLSLSLAMSILSWQCSQILLIDCGLVNPWLYLAMVSHKSRKSVWSVCLGLCRVIFVSKFLTKLPGQMIHRQFCFFLSYSQTLSSSWMFF